MTPARKNPLQHLRASDLRGVAQLATQATAGVARIAEGVHQAVWSTLGVPGGKTPGTTRGITRLVYQGIRGASQLLGKGLNTSLEQLEPWFASAEAARPETPQREAVLAALNGVLGDRLAATNSPFATAMTLRLRGRALDWRAPPARSDVTGKVVLMVHGLCMNDLQWQSSGTANSVDHGAALASALGYTPVYLRYNTGQHVSHNGHALSAALEQLAAHWPAALQAITVVAHSMGGLVIRSALHTAQQESLHWPATLRNIVFLGTPHHGAPLEKAGNWVDALLGSTRFAAPFARLAQLRSAGITDLRYGLLLDEDWQGHDRFRRQPDRRLPLPLPEGVACYTVAATTAAKRSLVADRLVGDGLVPLHSALGQHMDPGRSLAFAKGSQWIGYRMNHLDLLHHPDVTRQLLQWLAPVAPGSPCGP